MPISLRTGAACRIAGWKRGANMKPTPTSRTHWATPSGPRSILTPSASSTSALPHWLDAARLPCFATRPPAPATTSAVIVEMLMLLERSPPVPTTSIAPSSTTTRSAFARSALANPAISSGVSPRTCSAARSAPSCAGVASPAITDPIVASASARVSVLPDPMRPSASRASKEVLQHEQAVLRQDRFWVELHRLERQPCMPQRHDDAVVAARRDGEVAGERRLVDHQRVIARRLGGVRDTGEDAFAVVTHERGLAVPCLRRPHHPGAERDRGALQAQAHAERRDPALGRLAHELRGAPGGLGTPRSRRDHETIRTRVESGREPRVVGTHDVDARAQSAERLREVVGEAVVVIDEQYGRHRERPSPASSTARRRARALARVSASSAAGSESATIPAPAWIRQTPCAIVAVRMVMQVSSAPSNPR